MRLPALTLAVLVASTSPALARAQTTPMPDGRVLAFVELTLKPDVRAEDFERFYADSVAGPINRHIPGTRLYLLKGERGKRVGAYVQVWEFESLERRNEYFPQPDVPSERWQQLSKALPNTRPGMARYIAAGGPYTDYVVAR